MNTHLTQPPDILTPEQAAYLQVDRETVCRYIRNSKLSASKLGGAYGISKRSIDLLLWATRTRPDITLLEYTGASISAPLTADALDREAYAMIN